MDSTRYILIFMLILTVSTALLLTGIREITKEKAALNEEIFNKRAILGAVESHLPDGKKLGDLTDQDILDIFANQIEQVSLNMEGKPVEGVPAEKIDLAQEKKKPEAERLLPLFVYKNGEEKYYILSVRGKGLWDEIWGVIALESDLNTVTGVAFDHKSETPGLGAEIKDNPGFGKQFQGKKIYEGDNFVSVLVKKGGAVEGNLHQVDGITGATITSNGVTEMLQRGISLYLPYLQTLQPADNLQGSLTPQ